MWAYFLADWEKRQRLPPPISLWLDSWLLLLADETPPAWGVHPCSVETLRDIVVATTGTGSRDRWLRQGWIALISDHQPALARAGIIGSSFQVANGDEWHSDCQAWSRSNASTIPRHAYLSQLEASLVSNDSEGIFSWTRHLVNELVGEGRTRKELVQAALNGLRKDLFVELASWKCEVSALIDLPQSDYLALVRVVPIAASQTRLKEARARCSKLGIFIEDGDRILGFQYKVRGWDTGSCAAQAIKSARKLVEDLRTCSLFPVQIERVEVFGSDKSEVVTRSPLFEAGSARRRVPRIPEDFEDAIARLPTNIEKEQMWGARWHMSQAFARWPEDLHVAAAEIWQGIEAILGEGKSGDLLERMSAFYARKEALSSLEHFATKLTSLANNLPRGPRKEIIHNWKGFQSENPGGVLGWIDIVRRSNPTDWTPSIPLVLLGSRFGRLLRAHAAFVDPTSSGHHALILRDFRILYGLRCRVVHEGDRLLPEALTDHLARLGTEALLTATQEICRLASGGILSVIP